MGQCRRQSYHGFLSEDKEFFRSKEVDDEIDDHAECTTRLMAHKKTVPLYIGRTTGFCGSLTFLSTFIRDVFLALANDPPCRLDLTRMLHCSLLVQQERQHPMAGLISWLFLQSFPLKLAFHLQASC